MSARVRGAGPAFAALLAVVVLVTAACSGGRGGAVPDPPADVTGVVSDAVEPGAGPVLTGASDDYYEGMALLSEETMVVGVDGREASPESLDAGSEVEVWVAAECAESSPVQCVVEVVRIVG